jgi:alpha-beta hydrolase superfamily lysophospholipase
MNRHFKKTGSHCEQNCYDKIKQKKTKNKNLDSGKNKSKKIKKIMSKVNLLACLNSKDDESIEVKQELDVANDVEKIETEIYSRINANHKRFGVKINDDQDEIWTVAVNTQSKNTPIVLIHGYLAGIGIWRFNIDDLSESRPLYAIDLLGFGRSSRSHFGTDPIEVENQFVDSIEEWRKVMKLDKFVLLGHSFGGYIVTLYTLKYPQYIEKLILDDPWGNYDLLIIIKLLFNLNL